VANAVELVCTMLVWLSDNNVLATILPLFIQTITLTIILRYYVDSKGLLVSYSRG